MPLPAILQPYAKRKVRVVAGYGDAELIALTELKDPARKHWRMGTWCDAMVEVLACELSIEDWTAQLEASRVKP